MRTEKKIIQFRRKPEYQSVTRQQGRPHGAAGAAAAASIFYEFMGIVRYIKFKTIYYKVQYKVSSRPMDLPWGRSLDGSLSVRKKID